MAIPLPDRGLECPEFSYFADLNKIGHYSDLSIRQFPFDWDPADRILAATALTFDFTLVTAGERLLSLGNIKTLANR